MTGRYAEVKRKVSSLTTSGVTALATPVLIPTDVELRRLACAFPFNIECDDRMRLSLQSSQVNERADNR